MELLAIEQDEQARDDRDGQGADDRDRKRGRQRPCPCVPEVAGDAGSERRETVPSRVGKPPPPDRVDDVLGDRCQNGNERATGQPG